MVANNLNPLNHNVESKYSRTYDHAQWKIPTVQAYHFQV